MMAAKVPHPLALAGSAVEFPVTICVLAYGANVRLADRFLATLYQHTDPSLFQLRAGLNAVEPATRKLFEAYAARFANIRLFIARQNIFKCPMMRRMFHRPPLRNKWTIWCDDDTYFSRDDWLQRLAFKIEAAPGRGIWGKPYTLWRADATIVNWMEGAPWYRGKACVRARDPQGRAAVRFRFVTGGFWAIRTSLLKELDWPDARLVQAHDDFLLGEALRQNGVSSGEFEYGVKINEAPRRNAQAPEVQTIDFMSRLPRSEAPA